MQLKSLCLLLPIIAVGLGYQDVSSAPAHRSSGSSHTSSSAPRTDPAIDSDKNAHNCGCPTPAEVNEVLRRLGSADVPSSIVEAAFKSTGIHISSDLNFYSISDPLKIGTLDKPACVFDAASMAPGGCNFTNCYSINFRAASDETPPAAGATCPSATDPGSATTPLMVYNSSDETASCLAGAPSSTATLSDIGLFLGRDGTHCIYQKGVVKYHN